MVTQTRERGLEEVRSLYGPMLGSLIKGLESGQEVEWLPIKKRSSYSLAAEIRYLSILEKEYATGLSRAVGSPRRYSNVLTGIDERCNYLLEQIASIEG